MLIFSLSPERLLHEELRSCWGRRALLSDKRPNSDAFFEEKRELMLLMLLVAGVAVVQDELFLGFLQNFGLVCELSKLWPGWFVALWIWTQV